MQRDPNASDKARRAERRADEKSGLISIKPVKLDMGAGKASGGGFKKGGFKSAFGGADVKKEDDGEAEAAAVTRPAPGFKKIGDSTPTPVELPNAPRNAHDESDTEDDYDYYDPRKPTDCWEGCPGRT